MRQVAHLLPDGTAAIVRRAARWRAAGSWRLAAGSCSGDRSAPHVFCARRCDRFHSTQGTQGRRDPAAQLTSRAFLDAAAVRNGSRKKERPQRPPFAASSSPPFLTTSSSNSLSPLSSLKPILPAAQCRFGPPPSSASTPREATVASFDCASVPRPRVDLLRLNDRSREPVLVALLDHTGRPD